ncbi:uncharacterized protein BYT42DRAFT_548245 [Radiomyces spectabilis]|uniref:uncharacterized protein n=1 Tax=Radiomyces spectabilis TaxID=64574 RepID=UPI00221F72C6|nr:uncharacterized protein BYT42DRAFT_548245 [Radiomyces spectabilis]KAI8371363.1 hypothetical protein BYT42DRAFT_548245 [Radiomyces spectabilis]
METLTFREANSRFKAANERLDAILNSLHLDRKALKAWHQERASKRVCPINPRHRVPAPSFESHCRSCLSKQRGFYDRSQDKPLPATGTVPSDDDNSPNNRHQRVQLYQAIVRSSQQVRAQKNMAVPAVTDNQFSEIVEKAKNMRKDGSPGPSSFGNQQKAEERDYRRRRKQYRAKMQRQLVQAYMEDFKLWQDYITYQQASSSLQR